MDMEWNQALTFSEMVKDPVFLTGEIIQIGAINDARSTALLCTHLDLIRGLNEYKEWKCQEMCSREIPKI